MKVLVFWMESKVTSIVSDENLFPDTNEGEITTVLYKDGRKYQAKIVKKSHNERYLNSLHVSVEDGTIMNKKLTSKAPPSKNAKLEIRKKTKAMKSAANLKTLCSASIFEESSEEDCTTEIKDTLNQKRKYDDIEKESYEEVENKRRKEESDESEELIETESENESEGEERGKKKSGSSKRDARPERAREEEEARVRAQEEEAEMENQNLGEFEEEKAREREEKKRRKQERRVARERAREEEEARARAQEEEEARERALVEENIDRRAPARRANRNAIRDERHRQFERLDRVDEAMDPLLKCRLAGDRRVQLSRMYNVWIGETELAWIQRWRHNPREMTRGFSGDPNIHAVPQDIMDVVEFYVNRRCDFPLTPPQFTSVVNLMIGTLRNPHQ
uniref:Uncharacterized protein n=1 Tax=Trichogramma kaykai TaxID=54128 RepID=A0ABD2XFS7_9HYME